MNLCILNDSRKKSAQRVTTDSFIIGIKNMAPVAHVLTFIFTKIKTEDARNTSEVKKKQFLHDCMCLHHTCYAKRSKLTETHSAQHIQSTYKGMKILERILWQFFECSPTEDIFVPINGRC